MSSTIQKVPDASGWFSVVGMGDGIFAILEPHHFQEVISYLICGEERALLFDTGMGVADIREVVRSLTNLPVFVVNSHAHFDHVGGNCLFDEVYAFDNPRSLERLKAGYSREEIKGDAARKNFALIPPGFDPETYHIKPSCPITPIGDGHVFSLGGRDLRVLHTPGHSPDSIMLLEESAGRLFTGDTYYPATLYAHIIDPIAGMSDARLYAQSLDKLRPVLQKMKVLYTAHNEAECAPEGMLKAADAFSAIVKGEGPEGVLVVDDKYGFAEAPVFRYDFDGLIVYARKES